MGLGWGESVPVDTHVWQIAQRDYKFGKTKAKTFNKAMYDAVGDHFRGIWGEYAGWAHSVLFTADLREFSDKKQVQYAVEKAIKEDEEGATMVSPVEKRKRASTIENPVKVEVKLEDALLPVAANGSSLPKRRRTRTRA